MSVVWSKDLESAVAVVTGGASGLGFAAAAALCEAGVHLAILDRDGAGARRAADRLQVEGHGALSFEADIADEDRVADAFSGIVATTTRAAYAASKGGVIMLAKSLALELAPDAIRVNVIAPGAFETPIATEHHQGVGVGIRAAYAGRAAMARYGRPEEIGPLAVFLASDAVSSLTGQSSPSTAASRPSA